MSWLTAALKSSVGRKFLMGLTGLFLCLFLVVHLAGNLMLYVGPETYDEYAHKLHSNAELLVIAEVALFAAFVVHIALAISLTQTNNAAREQEYAVKQTKVPGRTLNLLGMTPDNTMVITGLVVFLFLIVHLSDFKFEWAWGDQLDGLEPYAKAKFILADAGRVLIYVVGTIVLGVHVAHGLASAFQSIGFNHPKYTPTIKSASRVFGLVVALGFGSIPLVFPNLVQIEDAEVHQLEKESGEVHLSDDKPTKVTSEDNNERGSSADDRQDKEHKAAATEAKHPVAEASAATPPAEAEKAPAEGEEAPAEENAVPAGETATGGTAEESKE
ncbi:MAG: succinate dehydrogenase cytochrome b subunit [Planctomycetaceae bacterium]